MIVTDSEIVEADVYFTNSSDVTPFMIYNVILLIKSEISLLELRYLLNSESLLLSVMFQIILSCII